MKVELPPIKEGKTKLQGDDLIERELNLSDFNNEDSEDSKRDQKPQKRNNDISEEVEVFSESDDNQDGGGGNNQINNRFQGALGKK